VTKQETIDFLSETGFELVQEVPANGEEDLRLEFQNHHFEGVTIRWFPERDYTFPFLISDLSEEPDTWTSFVGKAILLAAVKGERARHRRPDLPEPFGPEWYAEWRKFLGWGMPV
jgi:hypothetical protein